MATRTTSPTSGLSNTIQSLTAEERLKALAAKSDLSDRVILLFGSNLHSDPIVSSTATRLSAHGAQLILVEISKSGGDQGRLEKLAAAVDGSALHGHRWARRPDGKWARVQKSSVFRLYGEEFGGSVTFLVKAVFDSFGRLDGLVFKPQTSTTNSSLTLEVSSLMGKLEETITEELMLLVRFLQATVSHLEASGFGSIVTVSTTDALKPNANQLVTSISLSAIDMLLKCLSLELGPKNVRVNSVNHIPAPSNSNTFVPTGLEVNQSLMDEYVSKTLGEGGRSTLRGEDVASAVLYLLTPRSSFLNGANLVIDGGQTL